MSEATCSVIAQWVAHGASADVDARVGSHALGAVLGGGRGCQLRVDAAVSAIWIPLRGRLQIGSDGNALRAGDVRVTEAETRLHAIGRGNALWVVLLGRPAVWRQLMQARLGTPRMHAWLYAAVHAADFDLRRRALALARAVANDDRVAVACENVLERILSMQAGFSDAIARCPGRTWAQRRQVFVRLQRVRNYLASNCHLDVDNDTIARMANYSPWHFIRAFRAAYQETPHAYLVRQRLERAHRMLRASPLAIAEIALASGFENRCAFSRLFRQRFGMTAGTVRRMAAPGHARRPESAIAATRYAR